MRRTLPVLLDAIAIIAFVTIGLLSHHKGLGARGYARDLLPLLGGWFAAAALFRLYTRPGLRRLLATWLVGVGAGVFVRALILGRLGSSKEAAFLAVALVTIGVLVGLLRLAALLTRPWLAARRAGP